jgi:hypothetical protein
MVTCGGQATIPMGAAVSQVSKVHYAEIVASISSRSAGPGTRANIDEFTRTTASAIETVGDDRESACRQRNTQEDAGTWRSCTWNVGVRKFGFAVDLNLPINRTRPRLSRLRLDKKTRGKDNGID